MKMKRKILSRRIAAAIALLSLTACGYDELPPKTQDASSEYVLPEGSTPTTEELEELAAIRAEYEQSVR